MHPWLIVGAGGFIGAILRYSLGGWIQKGAESFPLGTLVINFTGSLVLAFIMYSSEYGGVFGPDERMFLTIGVMGAYTTMSTFSYESFKLLEDGQIPLFALNVLGTLASCLLAVYLGRLIALSYFNLQ
ncbi:MAG: fluoride efflux transporter CrcB [Candidatus Altiarchaeia archaeon]